jgi:hypothetical protein
MAPVFKRDPVSIERLPTNKRGYGNTPTTILKLFDDESVKRMNTERVDRRGFENPEPSTPTSAGRNYGNSSGGIDDDESFERPSPRMTFGRR